MSTPGLSTASAPPSPLGVFERYLTVWVVLCIGAGILLGVALPGGFQAIGRLEIAHVNMPVAALIWLMIVPMLLKVDPGSLHELRGQWRGGGGDDRGA